MLETFVEEGRHEGPNFEAANWRGETAGRGRQDRKYAATEAPNAVTNCTRGSVWKFPNRVLRR